MAADPAAAVTAHLHDIDRPALIVAVGKAARSMAAAAMARFPNAQTLVVTNYENAAPLLGAEVIAAGHPVPDAAGIAAARKVMTAVRAADGPVLTLISGGGSALLPAPVAGVSLAEKAEVNAALLGAGLDIRSMNLVRQQLSVIKGGGLLRLTAQPVTSLILSDVIGDDLAVIASGPTVSPIGSLEESLNILKENSIFDVLPSSVRSYLSDIHHASPVRAARNILVGSNGMSVTAMAAAAGQCHILPPIEGDVSDAAKMICDQARNGITVWGGETTVRLQGTGKGGRNQELALRIAIEAQRRGWTDWVCLQGGSDGRDGPTDAAGGIVDAGTLARVGDVGQYLKNNDSYRALAVAGDLLVTGPTGTNVADLGVLFR